MVSAANTADGFVAQQIFGAVGLKSGVDYTFLIWSGGLAGRAAAMTFKQAQVVLAYATEVTTLQSQGFKEFVQANEYPIMRDASTYSLVVNNAWVKANREAANAMYDPANKSTIGATIASQMKLTPDLVTTSINN